MGSAASLTLRRTSLDKDDIAVLDDVVLTLRHDLTLGLDLGLAAEVLEDVIRVDYSLDEGLLEVAVDDTGGLRGLGAVPDRPLSHLVRARGEEGAEVHGLTHRGDDLGQGGLGPDLFTLLVDLLLALEPSQAVFKGDGDGDDGVAWGVGLCPLGDLGQVLVLLADVVSLGEVDEVDNWLGGQEEERVNGFNLGWSSC